jgi:hypothetical protein
MVIGFASLLGLVGFFAEVFQAPPVPQDTVQLVRNPLPLEKLRQLRGMEFTNKAGTFRFENNHPDGALEGPWRMVEPTAMKARRDFFVKVGQALADIQVRHVHRTDPINLQSFFLHKPLFTLRLVPVIGAPVEIAFGLVNPIDNTTYFTLTDGPWIYQSQVFGLPLENVTAEELLDSRALAFNPDQVLSLEITPNGARLTKSEGQWLDGRGAALDNRKVEEFLLKLQTLKGHTVLDKLTPDQQAAVQRLMETPQATLRLGLPQGLETYHFSTPLDRVGDLKLERPGSVLLMREGAMNPVAMGKEQLSVLNKRESELR